MLNQIISTVLQILVLSLIPLIVFLITARKRTNFLTYIGMIPTTKKALWYALITSTLFIGGGIILAFISSEIKEILINPPSVTGQLRNLGFSTNTMIILLIIALFKTSLSEEIFFRGFIAKRLINKFGLATGNIIQALIFGVVHVLVFWFASNAGFLFLIFIFILSTAAGFLIEYINERYGNGSILPGWLAHGTGNAISFIILAFVI